MTNTTTIQTLVMESAREITAQMDMTKAQAAQALSCIEVSDAPETYGDIVFEGTVVEAIRINEGLIVSENGAADIEMIVHLVVARQLKAYSEIAVASTSGAGIHRLMDDFAMQMMDAKYTA